MRRLLIATTIFGVILSTPADAQGDSPKPADVISHHIKAVLSGDWGAVLNDYADTIVFVGHGVVVRGMPAYRQRVMAGAAQTPQPAFEITNTHIDNDVGEVDWILNAGKPNAMRGQDVYVIRNGKIQFQAVAFEHPMATN